MSGRDDRPIGVFDSGVGGLTVARELIAALPGEAIVYFGDTARVPYGSKSAETVTRYAAEAGQWLVAQEVKALVVACNTATAHAAAHLAATLPVPVLGVIEPGARAAAAASRTGRIGVIGTTGTIRSGAYDLAVRRLRPDARVYAQPCPLFVPIIEEGWSTHAVAKQIAAEYLAPLQDMDVDVLILGCTHYPLLRPVLQEAVGSSVTLVDSGRETAHDLAALLAERALLRDGGPPAAHRFVASDSPLRFRDVGRRLLGDALDAVECIDVDGYGRAA